MEMLNASSVQPPIHYPYQRTFWKEFWHDYCRITHFHGFHEMQSSRGPFNRIFWTTIILMGFFYAIYLMTIGITHFIEDPVDTHVTTVPQGELDFPVLYCPEHWIDRTQLIKGSEKFLLYALSYLRIPNYVYIPYEHMKPYSITMPPPRNTNPPQTLTNLISFQLSVHLSNKSPPGYYIGNSRLIVGSVPSLSYLLQWSDDQTRLVNDLYPIYLSDDPDNDLFGYIYYNLTFSYNVARDVYQYFFNENYAQMTSMWAEVELGRFNDDECLTLHDLDQIDQFGKSYSKINSSINGDWYCHYDHPKYTDDAQNLSRWLNIVNKKQTLLKIFNGSMFTKICHEKEKYCAKNKDEQILRMNLESKRTERIIELILAENVIDYDPKREIKENAIRNHLEQLNDREFDERVQALLSKAERKFLMEEKLEFEKFLTEYSYGDVLGFLKNVSFDESLFLVSFSTDSRRHIRPNSSKITSKRVVMADGTCILFRLQLDADTVGGWVSDFDYMILNEDPLQYPGERSSFDIYSLSPIKTVYVNVVARQNLNSLFASRQSNMISFGESAYANSQEFFDSVKFPVSFTKFQPTKKYDRYIIESVRNLVQTYRSVAPCKKRDLDMTEDEKGLPYSYSSCLLSCSDIYSNPKTVCGRTVNGTEALCRELASCAFVAENANFPANFEACSFFNLHQIYDQWTPTPKLYNANNSDKLDCFRNCFPPCQSFTFHIQRFVDAEDLADPAEKKTEHWSRLNDAAVQGLKKRNEILWMPENFFWSVSTFAEQVYQLDQIPQSRIEIEISTELTTYEEQPSFTWDTLFGVVGGQIGLVMGASCLTVVQLIWLLSISLYKYFAGRSQLVNLYKVSHAVVPEGNRPSITFYSADKL